MLHAYHVLDLIALESVLRASDKTACQSTIWASPCMLRAQMGMAVCDS